LSSAITGYSRRHSDVRRPRPERVLDPRPQGGGAAALAPRNHALVDGNKRLALAAIIAFLGVNGRRLTLTNDAAYELVMSMACGALDDVADIAAVLARPTEPRS